MDSQELLEQLADIHLPQAVSFWPLAPGWWVLALIVLVLAILVGRRLHAQLEQRRICEHALAELAHCYQQFKASAASDLDKQRLRFINEFNSVIRRVALVHFPQANVASLSGKEWVDFIRKKGDSSLLNDELAAALSYGRFQTRCYVDPDALDALGRAWITSLYLDKHQISSDPQGQTT
jgi:hypothetical protein